MYSIGALAQGAEAQQAIDNQAAMERDAQAVVSAENAKRRRMDRMEAEAHRMYEDETNGAPPMRRRPRGGGGMFMGFGHPGMKMFLAGAALGFLLARAFRK